MDDQSSVAEFLKRIAQIESSNKYDAQHPVIRAGMHRGMQAVGKYGLMPYTIAEILGRKVSDDEQAVRSMPSEPPAGFVGPSEEPPTSEYDPGEEGVAGLLRFVDPRGNPHSRDYREGAIMAASNLQEMPETQDYLASLLARRLLEKTGGDQDRAAYMWTMGHNTPIAAVTPEKLDQSDYVRKFRTLAARDSDVPQLEEAPAPLVQPKRFVRTRRTYQKS